ncbi:hypothetical protein [Neisseria meningitidis]|uniref:Phage associated protein n=1 Tax=Neisseria meningitidis TaxID=487 RepID=A0AB36RN89_NEIME|nr:hypothetical protein [Neisseria meningitidis]PBJ86940.1 hypothetical protein CNQ34_13525 [Neisseria meningitidis]
MKALRIKEEQEESIRRLAINANKKLIQLGREPLRDSELAHILLKAIRCAKIDDDGKITIGN